MREPGSRAFILLLRSEADADAAAALLRRSGVAGESCTVAVSPVRGIEFFTNASAQPALDAWWGASVRPGAEPVFFIEHAPGLGEWLRDMDGMFVVGGCPPGTEEVYDSERTLLLQAAAPDDYVRALKRELPREPTDEDEPFHADPLLEMAPEEAPPPLVDPGFASPEGRAGDPFELLAAMDEPPSRPAQALPEARRLPAAASSLPLRLPMSAFLRRTKRRSPGQRMVDGDLGPLLTARGATIVAVGSRKGGVGKTSHAAGMAIVAGSVLDPLGHRAAIVDANVANPDAWGQLNLPGGAATVRDVVDALVTNHEPPRPVYASTPALACYPESREATEYSRTDVIRFAHHLRDRYAFTVIDLCNRLPDPLAGPEAAAAAYWLEQADCLVLPSASSKQDFNGVLDYLEMSDLPPAVVAYITPSTRRNREHPLTRRYLAAIRQRACSVVELPDEPDRVRYAGMEGVPVEEVSPALGAAYRDLVQAVASLPRLRGS